MSLLNTIRSHIAPQNPLLLLYHKIIAFLAALWYRFPANSLKVIAITGAQGKSPTVRLLCEILRQAGHKVGAASTIQFRVGETVWENDTKMTTLGRFQLQKLLRMMVDERCDFAVIEATSQAL